MRLWHTDLLSKLPQKQLSGQWREVIALLGNGWGRNHSTVNYVFNHSVDKLLAYSKLVADEMERRGWKPRRELLIKALLKRHSDSVVELIEFGSSYWYKQKVIYIQHNSKYLQECLENLSSKGINI